MSACPQINQAFISQKEVSRQTYHSFLKERFNNSKLIEEYLGSNDKGKPTSDLVLKAQSQSQPKEKHSHGKGSGKERNGNIKDRETKRKRERKTTVRVKKSREE